MTQTAAIVTTLKQPGPSLVSFLKYHLAIGFSRIFLFFDDPSDSDIRVAHDFRNVRIIKADARLRRRWGQTRTALSNPWFYGFVDAELKVRQTLNVEIAIGLARQERIDWLLHIDCDELFFPAQGSAPAHFAAMAKRKLSNLIYANYEGVPELIDVEDPFKGVTLFKKNFSLTRQPLNSGQRKLIKKLSQFPAHLFLFYANGKSAARVTDELRPNGGHRFEYADRKREKSRGERRKAPTLCDDAIILHYPSCGFQNFWRKYKMLGAFPDRWFDRIDVAKAIGSFHLESRDIVLQGRRAARTFYKERVVIKQKKTVDSLLNAGIVCRVNDPSEFLNGSKSIDANHQPRPRS
jgi:Glycosyl transferase family 2